MCPESILRGTHTRRYNFGRHTSNSKKSADTRAVTLLRDALRVAEHDLIRIRLAGGAMQTVFSKTIRYLL